MLYHKLSFNKHKNPHRDRRFLGVFLPRRVHAVGTRAFLGQGIVDALLAEVVAAGKVVRVAQKAAAMVPRGTKKGGAGVDGGGKARLRTLKSPSCTRLQRKHNKKIVVHRNYHRSLLGRSLLGGIPHSRLLLIEAKQLRTLR